MGSWQQRVVDRLCELKADGAPFERAWQQAMTDYPPRGRDLGPERPSLLDEAESVVAFFRRCCEDAWYGRRPALQHFHASLLIDRDDTTEAILTTQQRRLAA